MQQLARDLEDSGRRDLCLQAGGEPAMLALQQALAMARNGTTVLQNASSGLLGLAGLPGYTPQANSGAEKAL